MTTSKDAEETTNIAKAVMEEKGMFCDEFRATDGPRYEYGNSEEFGVNIELGYH